MIGRRSLFQTFKSHNEERTQQRLGKQSIPRREGRPSGHPSHTPNFLGRDIKPFREPQHRLSGFHRDGDQRTRMRTRSRVRSMYENRIDGARYRR